MAPKSIRNHPKSKFSTVVRTVKICFKRFSMHGQISVRGQRQIGMLFQPRRCPYAGCTVAPIVRLESTFKRTFNNMQVSG